MLVEAVGACLALLQKHLLTSSLLHRQHTYVTIASITMRVKQLSASAPCNFMYAWISSMTIYIHTQL